MELRDARNEVTGKRFCRPADTARLQVPRIWAERPTRSELQRSGYAVVMKWLTE